MKGHISTRGVFAVLYVVIFLAVSAGFAAPAGAQDTIKVAVGQIDAWANQVPTLGMSEDDGLLARFHAPHARRMIEGCRNRALAIRAECDATH